MSRLFMIFLKKFRFLHVDTPKIDLEIVYSFIFNKQSLIEKALVERLSLFTPYSLVV